MDIIQRQIKLYEAIAAAKTKEVGFPVSTEDVFRALLMRVQKDHIIEQSVELWSIEPTSWLLERIPSRKKKFAYISHTIIILIQAIYNGSLGTGNTTK